MSLTGILLWSYSRRSCEEPKFRIAVFHFPNTHHIGLLKRMDRSTEAWSNVQHKVCPQLAALLLLLTVPYSKRRAVIKHSLFLFLLFLLLLLLRYKVQTIKCSDLTHTKSSHPSEGTDHLHVPQKHPVPASQPNSWPRHCSALDRP